MITPTSVMSWPILVLLRPARSYSAPRPRVRLSAYWVQLCTALAGENDPEHEWHGQRRWYVTFCIVEGILSVLLGTEDMSLFDHPCRAMSAEGYSRCFSCAMLSLFVVTQLVSGILKPCEFARGYIYILSYSYQFHLLIDLSSEGVP